MTDADLGGESACFAHLLDDDLLDPRAAAFTLTPTAPFRLDLTVRVARRGTRNAVDRWDEDLGAYRRVFAPASGTVEVTVRQTGPPDAPELRVEVFGDTARLLATRVEVERTLVDLLGLDLDTSGFRRLASGDPLLGPLAQRFEGVRPTRFPSWDEAIAAVVSCQQVSLTVGIELLNRLAETFGAPGPRGGHAFPGAAALAGADPQDLRHLGYSGRKASAIVELSSRIANGSFPPPFLADADAAATVPYDDAVAELCTLAGIGPWSAHYLLLRRLGRLDRLPPGDSGARRTLRRLSGHDDLDDASVDRLASRWTPYGGLAYFHLLLASRERTEVASPPEF